MLQKSFVAHAQVSYSYWTPHVMQDTLDQSVVNQTQDRSELEVHFHTLKDVRQLGANSSSFPSAAEVPLPMRITPVTMDIVALNSWSCALLPGAQQQLHACEPAV